MGEAKLYRRFIIALCSLAAIGITALFATRTAFFVQGNSTPEFFFSVVWRDLAGIICWTIAAWTIFKRSNLALISAILLIFLAIFDLYSARGIFAMLANGTLQSAVLMFVLFTFFYKVLVAEFVVRSWLARTDK